MGHRKNKRLMVVLVQAPGGGDMFNWTNEYTMVFRAYSLPYWSDTAYTTVQSKSKKSTTTSIDVPGNTETVADITVENMSGAKIDRISITVGDSKMDFTGLAMTGTESLIIDHIHRADIYYIRARMKDGDNTRTVLQNRTGANDFYVQPGTQQVVVDADRAVQTTVSIKGRYL